MARTATVMRVSVLRAWAPFRSGILPHLRRTGPSGPSYIFVFHLGAPRFNGCTRGPGSEDWVLRGQGPSPYDEFVRFANDRVLTIYLTAALSIALLAGCGGSSPAHPDLSGAANDSADAAPAQGAARLETPPVAGAAAGLPRPP